MSAPAAVRANLHALLEGPLRGAVASGETQAHLLLGLLDRLVDLATDEQLVGAQMSEMLSAERFHLYLIEAKAKASPDVAERAAEITALFHQKLKDRKRARGARC